MRGKTWRELYTHCNKTLHSTVEGRELFAFVTGYKVSDLPFMGGQEAIAEQWSQLDALCNRRLAGEPLQYLIGQWDFYGLTLTVGPGVLIPRSDTEVLVTTALKELQNIPRPQVLDLCSGSGAIALAIAQQCPKAHVTAVELSEQAFAYLEQNNKTYGSRVTTVLADVLQYNHPTPVDVILSNPPYIPAGDLANLQIEVQQEPMMALDGGKDGLDFYRFITQRYHSQLKEGGLIAFEVGFDQSQSVQDILRQAELEQIQCIPDLSGINRVVIGRKKMVAGNS